MYRIHQDHILRQHEKGNVKSGYNFPTRDLSEGYNEIYKHLVKIYEDQNQTFKLNLSLGVILKNIETGDFRYFIPDKHFEVLTSPAIVNKRSDLKKILTSLKNIDLTGDYIRLKRDSTKWQPHFVTNINYNVYNTGYPMGTYVTNNLPLYISKKKCIKTLTTDPISKRRYKDHLCMFRALVYHNKQEQNLREKTKEYFETWVEKQGINITYLKNLYVYINQL